MYVKSLLLTIAVFSHCITSSDACGEIEIECSNETCTKCYKTLATELLKNDTNYINLQNTFFPSDNNGPDFVIVTYVYTSSDSSYHVSTSHTWFWSSSAYFFYHPLRVFQYTSLGFSDPSLKQSNIKLYLPASCYDNGSETYYNYMQLLTQRVS